MPRPLAKRVYGGQSAEVRAANRREQLLDAALEIIGKNGYQSTKITDICRSAGVSQRYFYEAFEGSEDLLIQLYNRELGKLIGAMSSSMNAVEEDSVSSLESTLRNFFKTINDNQFSTRIIFFELHGVSQKTRAVFLGGRRRSKRLLKDYMILLFADVFSNEFDYELFATALIGAIIELARSWLEGELDATAEDLVDRLMDIINQLTSSGT